MFYWKYRGANPLYTKKEKGMKKVFIAMLLVLALVTPIFANGAQEAQKATFDKTAPVTITFWTHEDAARQRLEDAWLDEFRAAHPNVTIDVLTKLLSAET